MITGEQVWLAIEPIDMRAGIDRLSLQVQQSLGRSPTDGSLYAFRNRLGTRLALLVWDGNGVWLAKRRLHQGHFTWPGNTEQVAAVTARQWQYLIAGVDWQRLEAAPQADWKL
jgi:transposase